MEIMDPFAHELLARPPPPAFDFFPAVGDVDTINTEIAIGQLDDYFRAIGVLPSLTPVDVPPAPGYTTAAATVWDAMDYGVGVDLPVTHELYSAAVDAHVQPAAPLPAQSTSSSYGDGAAAALATYDSDIDASLRATESDARERPSPDYLDATRGGRMDPTARFALVAWMFDFARHFDIGPAALHRAVSYADRSFSARAITGGVDIDYPLRLLGAAAVYAAAKHEDRDTVRRVNARDIAACCGFAASQEVLDTERAMLAALGYRLGGLTAHTFVEHFTRHGGQREEYLELRRTAHLIADSSLFDHRCLRLLPSAVAAAAILLARLFLTPSHDREQVRRWGRELEELTGYKRMDVYDGLDCMHKMMPDDPGFQISLLFADPS